MQKVAIVHDWLTAPGGAEHVLKQMLIAFPQADVFTLCNFLEEKHHGFLMGKIPTTSLIQKLPFAKTKHWLYLPLMPLCIEQFDLSAYDIVLSSSYCVAKGVLSGPSQIHVSYIHTPVRYAWHLQHQYLQEMKLDKGIVGLVCRAILHYIRIWDVRSAAGVDSFIANSRYVARQVHRLYNRECTVLHPPVDISRLPLVELKEDYYVTASRMVPYKRIDLIVKAFARMPDKRLVVIGGGQELARIEKFARGYSNIEVLGYQPEATLVRHISKAKAFIFAAIEDFGIAPLEAQACGTPVIALAKGGACETISSLGRSHPTGVFFSEQNEDSIIAAVAEFEVKGHVIKPQDCRANAEKFANEEFRSRLQEHVQRVVIRDSLQ